MAASSVSEVMQKTHGCINVWHWTGRSFHHIDSMGKAEKDRRAHTCHNYTLCCYLQDYHAQKAFCNQ